MNFFKISLSVFLCVLQKITAADIPSFMDPCRRSDPNLEQCIIHSVEVIRPYLAKGIPEFKVPGIEPLVMKDLIAEETAGIKIITTNVSAYGCSDFSVKKIDLDADNQVYTLFVDLPKLRIEANYNVDGKLLLMPLKGNGDMEANVTDLVTVCVLQGEIYQKDGEDYLKFISIDLKVKVGGGHVLLENLFNGDKVILGLINDVVNKNLNSFLKDLMPAIERALGRVFLEIANDIVEPFTFQQLFPE